MAVTYDKIATNTLGSAASSVTFSSIPATYTDLVLVINAKGSASSYPTIRLNGDTGSNYSDTELNGNGTAAASGRNSNTSVMYFTRSAVWTTSDFSFNAIANFQNYSNATTYKTVLSRANAAGSSVDAVVSLWRATPAAINQIVVSATSGTMEIGSTFTIYGIKAA